MRVSDLRPGLLLASPVRDVNGRLLMSVGTCLNDRYIGVLKAWGIGDVEIQGEGEPEIDGPGEDLPEELVAKARDIVVARLARNDLDNPFIHEVFHLAVARTASLLDRGLQTQLPPSGAPGPAPSEESLGPIDLTALTASNPALGAMPEVLGRLAQTMDNPGASPLEVADIIQNDPGLAAKLLKVVNSALYGFPQRIETISRAVTVIGVQQLAALALGLTVMGLFKNIPKDLLDIKEFWRHCLACACGARALASALGLPNTERYFVAGLLHDVGLLLFILHAPEHVRRVLSEVRMSQDSFTSTEQRILGVDHCMAGAALLSSWKLPSSLVQAAGYHHEPLLAQDPKDATIVHVADFMAETLLFGSGGQSVVMPLDQTAFGMLLAPQGIAGTVFERVEEQFSHLESIFVSNVPN